MKNKEFRNLSAAERQNRLERIIRTRTEDMLNREHLSRIMRAVDVGEQYSVRVVNEPAVFESAITLKQVHVFISDHEKSTETKGMTLFGAFDFGESVLKTDTMKQSSGRTHKAVLMDTETPAAALIETRNLGYEELSVLLNSKEIVIYVPRTLNQKAG